MIIELDQIITDTEDLLISPFKYISIKLQDTVYLYPNKYLFNISSLFDKNYVVIDGKFDKIFLDYLAYNAKIYIDTQSLNTLLLFCESIQTNSYVYQKIYYNLLKYNCNYDYKIIDKYIMNSHETKESYELYYNPIDKNYELKVKIIDTYFPENYKIVTKHLHDFSTNHYFNISLYKKITKINRKILIFIFKEINSRQNKFFIDKIKKIVNNCIFNQKLLSQFD